MELDVTGLTNIEKTLNMETKVWAQMFFNDGSVTEGKYISVIEFSDPDEGLKKYAKKFLEDLNRKEGLILVWGAGNLWGKHAHLVHHAKGEFKDQSTITLKNMM